MHGKKKFTERGRCTHISRAKVVAGCEGSGQYALCVHNVYLFLHTLLTPIYTHKVYFIRFDVRLYLDFVKIDLLLKSFLEKKRATPIKKK